MDIAIEIDKATRLVRVTPNEMVTLERVIETINRMLEHPDFDPGMPSLWDYRSCPDVSFSAEELRQLGDIANQNASRRGHARLAVVAGSESQFGLSRMFAMLNDMTHLEFLVSRDIVEAERRLLREDEPGEGKLE